MTTANKLSIVANALSKADLTDITFHGVTKLLRDKAQLSIAEIFLVWRGISETRKQLKR